MFLLAAPGVSSFEYYALSSAISAAHPDQLVIAFNLASLSHGWRSRWDRVELAGWIPPSRLGEAIALPLYSWGLTLDRLLLYVGLVRFGLEGQWYSYRRQQVRVDRGIRDLREWCQRTVGIGGNGLPPVKSGLHPKLRNRFGPDRLRSSYGEALRGVTQEHPVLRLLRAALHAFHVAGIPTLVYVVPVNVEHLTRVGLAPGEGLRTTLGSLRSLVVEEGGKFLDIHDLLPDAGFRDPSGHFVFDGAIDGPKVVAAEITKALFPDRLPPASAAWRCGG